MRSFDAQRYLDGLAISASALCLVHCLATPLLIVLLPILASIGLADEAFHRWMLLLIVPTSVLALWLGCRRHKSRAVLYAGVTGLTLIGAAAIWGHVLVGEFGEKAATVAGGLILAAGHWRNYRLCRDAECVC